MGEREGSWQDWALPPQQFCQFFPEPDSCVYSVEVTPWGKIQGLGKGTAYCGYSFTSYYEAPSRPPHCQSGALILTYRYPELSSTRPSPVSRIALLIHLSTKLTFSSAPEHWLAEPRKGLVVVIHTMVWMNGFWLTPSTILYFPKRILLILEIEWLMA